MILPAGLDGVAFGTAADGNPRLDRGARRTAAARLGIGSEWAWVRQVHGAGVAEATGPGVGGEADGVFTRRRELPVAVSVADCFPVALLADGAVGMAHAGWRGAAGGVAEATVGAMTAAGHPPHTAVIGPGIGPCCFEVGGEVLERFPGHEARTTWGTASVDLPGALAAALPGLRVHRTGGCTRHEDRFHSFRRDGTERRQFGIAWVAAPRISAPAGRGA